MGSRRRTAAIALVVAVLAITWPATGSNALERTRVQSEGDDGSDAPSLSDEGRRAGSDTKPGGLVAYVRANGEVWLGLGNEEPDLVAALAAIGSNGQAAVAVSPAGDSVAYVRSDGALVLVEVDGTESRVLATDVALEAVGLAPVIAWDGTGKTISYVAEGTDDDVPDEVTQSREVNPDAFLTTLPDGPLGNVVRMVDLDGGATSSYGDPSGRDIFGVATSLTDPLVLVQSRIPGTEDRYTIALAGVETDLTPTPLSVDEPEFSPDGSFVLAVGPVDSRQEILRLDLSDFSRDAIARDEAICAPAVSPDATRVVYGSGPDCSRLSVVSSVGGQSFDITPSESPATASFGVAPLGWSSDGRFVTYPRCTGIGAELSCDGTSWFVEPDTGRVLEGPPAVTVAPIERALIQDIFLDFQMRGPIEASASFPISAEIEGALTNTDRGGVLEAEVTDGTAAMSVHFEALDTSFVTGTIALNDPESGIDRTFTILARPSLLGLRILSLSGIWMSTNDLPFATGEFNMAIRRR